MPLQHGGQSVQIRHTFPVVTHGMPEVPMIAEAFATAKSPAKRIVVRRADMLLDIQRVSERNEHDGTVPASPPLEIVGGATGFTRIVYNVRQNIVELLFFFLSVWRCPPSSSFFF